MHISEREMSEEASYVATPAGASMRIRHWRASISIYMIYDNSASDEYSDDMMYVYR